MPISLTCPGCQRKLAVPDSAAGKTVKCPKCEVTTRVPAAEPAEIAAVVEDEPEALASPGRSPAPHHADLDDRPQRRSRIDDDVDDAPQPPRRRARPQELEELEEDEQRERARQTKKSMSAGAVIVGIISAFITLLAFGGVAAGAWLSTRLFDNKIDQATGQLWRQVSIYSACGLAVAGFILSLYSRGVLRILTLLFAVVSAAAATLGMLAITSVITNPFEDYSKGRGASGGSGSGSSSASVASSPGIGPKLEVGATYALHALPNNQPVLAFKDTESIGKFQQAMHDAMGGRGGPDGPGPRGGGRSGPPGRGGPDGRPGGPDVPPGGGSGPGGRGGPADMAKMQEVINKLKDEHVLFILPIGTKVKLLKDDTNPKVLVLDDGEFKDQEFYLLSRVTLGNKQ
jgi:hypothetical protein